MSNIFNKKKGIDNILAISTFLNACSKHSTELFLEIFDKMPPEDSLRITNILYKKYLEKELHEGNKL